MRRVAPDRRGDRAAARRGWRFRRPSQMLRGRAAMLLLVIVLAGAGAALAASASQAAGPDDPAVVVVQRGDTLWSVTARHLPSRDPYGMIEEIRQLNDLTGHTIHPGQRLVLPAR